MPSVCRQKLSCRHRWESLNVLSQIFAKDCVVNGVAHLSCPAEEKVAVLKKLMDLNIPLADITITDQAWNRSF